MSWREVPVELDRRGALGLGTAIVLGAVALLAIPLLLGAAPRDDGYITDDLARGAPDPRWVTPLPDPTAAPERDPAAGLAGRVDPGWVGHVSAATGIPARALRAYAGAALEKTAQMPECRISWVTLAAIAAVESGHGTHGGSELDAAGRAVPPIYGPRLSPRVFPDTDGGAVDADPDGERAAGPMQFIPETWAQWQADGDGDGTADPQQIDDAALAASHYLCRASSPHSSEAGWRAAVFAYNHEEEYVDEVARWATRYAEAAARAG